jgi:hypothetical protein
LSRIASSVVAAALVGLLIAASAAGTAPTQNRKVVRHFPRRRGGALGIEGSRIAYGVGSRVLVWNVRTGKTVQVSGRKTAELVAAGAGVDQLAIAGSRVAWLLYNAGQTEGDDHLFTSSTVAPKERRVASEVRFGYYCPGRSARCAGKWLGGLVGSGTFIAANRWTTDGTGVTAGQLDLLDGTKLKQIATGVNTVQAAVADRGRVAVLHADGSVALYSASGRPLLNLNTPNTEAVALSGKNLLVATKTSPFQLELYDARTGSLRKTFDAHGIERPRNLDVPGNIAIYTTGAELVLHAVNLSTGKDRVIFEPHGGVISSFLDRAGLVYTNGGNGWLAFEPFARVAAAVG